MPISNCPIKVKLLLNDTSNTCFEVDTGSFVSTLRQDDAIRAGICIIPTSETALAYGGASIHLLGECIIPVRLGDVSKEVKFLVVDNKEVNLFGRDLCNVFNINLAVPSDTNSFYNIKNDVLKKHAEYLSEDFKSCVKETVSLNLTPPDCKPIFAKARPVPVKMKSKVDAEINRLVDAGILTKVYRSNWASPTVNVIKKNGQVRLCGDFSSTVNCYLDPVNYPLPSIDDVISQMNNSKVFSKLDLQNAYLQLPLDSNSKQFCTINTCSGLYAFNFLPFGLTASSGIFQSFISKLLNGIPGVINYQDDILIHSSDINQHNVTLDKVLTVLKEAGIKLNNKKCDFYVTKVEYLGHIFDANGVQPNPDKIRAIIDAPAPRNVKQTQAFVGLCNYYSRFIRNFASKFAPLYALLKKNAQFKWNEEQQQCFDLIKKLFKNHGVLKIFDSNKETLLETDSSAYGTAAVLMQRDNPGEMWYPIEFASRTLNSNEQNYSNLEREALSVIFGVTKFRKYLLGLPFVIHNDQMPLRKLFAHNASIPLNCSARVQRWALKLSQFNYEFIYSKGVDNVNSDCLSRIPLSDTEHVCEPYELIFSINSINVMPITCHDIKNHTNMSKDLTELKHFIKYGFPNRLNNQNLKIFQSKANQLSIFDDCIMFGNRVFIPESLRTIVLNQIHDGHPGISAMKSIARSIIWYPNLDIDIENLVKSCNQCMAVAAKPKKSNVQWPIPKRVWSRVHIDHFFFENHICLVVVDALSRYIECEIVKNTSAAETIEALRLVFSRNGLCDVIVSDNCSSFTAQDFGDFLKQNGIEHITSPPYQPASNGQAEVSVRIIKDMMKKNKCNLSFKSRLSKVLMQYRSCPHSVTKSSPSVALNGRKLITVRDKLNPHFCTAEKSTESKSIRTFETGDKVFVLNLREGEKWLEGTVIQKLGINVYGVHIESLNVIWKRHANQLLRYSNKNFPIQSHLSNDFPYQNSNPMLSNDDLLVDKSHNPNVSNVENNDSTVENNDLLNDIPDTQNDFADSSPPISDQSGPILRRSERIRKPVARYGIDEY